MAYKKSKETADEIAIAIYIKEINKIPLLTKEEELELAKKAEKGDKKAKEKLVTSNLRFVVSVAKTNQNRGLPLEDLISEGNAGIIIAAEKYNLRKHVRFISYAVWWIKQTIGREINNHSKVIRLPVNRERDLLRIKGICDDLYLKNGYSPSVSEISELTGFSEDKVNLTLSLNYDMLSSESLRKRCDTPNELSDERYSLERETIEKDSKDNIREVVSSILSNKEYDIISRLFGFGLGEGETLKSVGDKYHITKERVRQIKERAITKLINSGVRTEVLRDYLK